jgi:hypothetical protein
MCQPIITASKAFVMRTLSHVERSSPLDQAQLSEIFFAG